MKILHLYTGNLYGGVETLLKTMAALRHLAPEMDPEFGLCFRGRLWDELAATGVPVCDLMPIRISRPWTVRRGRQRLRQVLADARPDVVATHDFWPHSVFSPVVRQAGCRLVNFVHGAASGDHWLERWAGRVPPDLAVANSRFTATQVNTVFPGVPTVSWHLPVARPVVDAVGRLQLRSELGTPRDTTVILQASRLEQWKGHAVLIDALERLRKLRGWECWVAGGAQKRGEARFVAELKAAAARAGIAERVRFLGQRNDVPRLMAAADVFCQPNTAPEPFGVALVEALYAGLPVVTSGFGGAAEIVDESCGLLTKPGDASAIAAALQSLIESPSRRQMLGATGPRRAESLCDPARQLQAALSFLRPASPESLGPRLSGLRSRRPMPVRS